MTFGKTLLTVAAYLCVAAPVLAEGAPDIYFKTQHLHDHDGTVCRTGISPFRGNLALMDKVVTGQQAGKARIRTFDRVHHKKNTYYITGGFSGGPLEVSDSGPGNFINVVYMDSNGLGSAARPMFSTDSGATFQQLTLTPKAGYPTYLTGSFGRTSVDVGKNTMKFDSNGRLHVFWFTRGATNHFVLNHQVFNKDGTTDFSEFLAEPHAPDIFWNTLTLSGARINVVATDTKVVAITQNPSIGWWCAACGAGLTKWDVPVAIVHDVASKTATQTIGVGATSYSTNQTWYNSLSGMFGNPITSDGVNVFLINQTPPVSTLFGSTNNFQIRKFPRSTDGKGYFPDNRPHPTDGAMTDLENMSAPDPKVETSSFWTDTQPGVANGVVYGFVAPRWRRNQPGWVDLIYKTPDQMVNGTNQDYVQRMRFNPDVALSLQQALSKPIMLNEVANGTYHPPGAGQNPSGITLGPGTFDTGSVDGGSAVSWCQNEAVSFDGLYTYFLQAMDIN